MKGFINTYFLLENKTAQKLYYEVASKQPVIDYHNHLDVQFLANDKNFENITRLWISEDPYKHRAMRINGIPEEYITGNASDKEKFFSWAKTFPNTIGNSLFHWSCLELKWYFGINEILTINNADKIWKSCNDKISRGEFKALEILRSGNVELLYTSNDLLENFESHKKMNSRDIGCKVTPSLRGDAIVAIDNTEFEGWKEKLEKKSGIQINNLTDYKEVIREKLNEFELYDNSSLSDHALDAGFKFQLPTEKKAEEIFTKLLLKKSLSKKATIQLKSHLLHFLGKEYGEREWIMQLHIGAQRSTSSRLRKITGPTGGYACIGEPCNIDSICSFLDSLEIESALPKTIIYNLNPADNEAIASLTGSFTGNGVPGKIQFGPAWWYNDHYEGIRRHLSVLANYSLLSQFIGMVTDSRSILSFSRHDYFRRVLCTTLGDWVEAGFIPDDYGLLKKLTKNICYQNIKKYIAKKR